MAKEAKERKWRFIEGKEQVIVLLGLAFAYAVMIFMVGFLYSNLMDKNTLEMKFESEKSFNSVYMALSDSNAKAISAMEEESVSAIGIYNSNGTLFKGLGDAPSVIPFAQFILARQRGLDSTLGVYNLNEDTKEIEYIRLSRLNVVLETGSLSITENGFLPAPVEFPEIIYVKFDGSRYYREVFTTRLVTVISAVAITFLFMVVLNIYQSNRRYRLALAKNESLAALGAAARTLTHEIKNPLSAMTIQSALLKKMLPSEYQGDLAVMDQEIKRLTHLTNRVSEFLRNPLGNPEEIEIVEFVTTITKLFETPVKILETSLKKAYIEIDEDRARSVFENLIKNATESSHDKDPEVEVEILKGKRKTIHIFVRDRGDGLPIAARDRIFDPFFTTKIHGSGIGLSISRQFIQARGGTLKLFDRDGGGTVAEVILPGHEEKSE